MCRRGRGSRNGWIGGAILSDSADLHPALTSGAPLLHGLTPRSVHVETAAEV